MIAIVKYNAGNTRSVQNALRRLGVSSQVTSDPAALRRADKVIFPGVGEAGSAMHFLRERGLDGLLPELRQPVLGICLGLQLMCAHSEEGDTACLGIFPNEVRRFRSTERIPHMGWNALADLKGELYPNVAPGADLYFVHSYRAEVNEFTTATCTYADTFSASLQRRNFYATQFHPEKSAGVGEQILLNFLNV